MSPLLVEQDHVIREFTGLLCYLFCFLFLQFFKNPADDSIYIIFPDEVVPALRGLPKNKTTNSLPQNISVSAKIDARVFLSKNIGAFCMLIAPFVVILNSSKPPGDSLHHLVCDIQDNYHHDISHYRPPYPTAGVRRVS